MLCVVGELREKVEQRLKGRGYMSHDGGVFSTLHEELESCGIRADYT